MHKRVVYVLLATFTMMTGMFLTGCDKKEEGKRVRDIEFTVCDDSKVPKAFLQEIGKKKEQEFISTYKDGEYMYVARGYGKQSTGGYSINVADFFESENKIIFKTNLVGPGQKDLVLREATYPYIVVKMEYSQKDVVWED